jgi:hypothetical protein
MSAVLNQITSQHLTILLHRNIENSTTLMINKDNIYFELERASIFNLDQIFNPIQYIYKRYAVTRLLKIGCL